MLRAAAVDRVVAMPDGSTAPVVFLFKGGTSLSRVAEVREAIRTGFEAAQMLIHGTRISLNDVTATVLANRERL